MISTHPGPSPAAEGALTGQRKNLRRTYNGRRRGGGCRRRAARSTARGRARTARGLRRTVHARACTRHAPGGEGAEARDHGPATPAAGRRCSCAPLSVFQAPAWFFLSKANRRRKKRKKKKKKKKKKRSTA